MGTERVYGAGAVAPGSGVTGPTGPAGGVGATGPTGPGGIGDAGLSDLTDVSIDTGIEDGDVLVYGGTDGVFHNEKLTEASFTPVNDSEVLVGPVSGGPTGPTFRTLQDADLSNVSIDALSNVRATGSTGPLAGQVLSFDEASGEWQYGTIAEGAFARQMANVVFAGPPSVGGFGSTIIDAIQDDLVFLFDFDDLIAPANEEYQGATAEVSVGSPSFGESSLLDKAVKFTYTDTIETTSDEILNLPSGVSPFSIAVWWKRNEPGFTFAQLTTDLIEFEQGGDIYRFTYVRDIATIYFTKNGTTLASRAGIAVGIDTYDHMIVTRSSSGDWTFYHNNVNHGTSVNDTSTAVDLNGGIVRFAPAARHSTNIRHLDQVVFWNTELTVSQVADLYNSGTGREFAGTQYPSFRSLVDADLADVSLNALSNVTATGPTGPTDGDILKYDSTTDTWVFDEGQAVAGNSETIVQDNSFSPGDVIYLDNSATDPTWELAKADDVVTAEALGVVEDVTASTFKVVFSGKISGLSGLYPGEAYFLSDVTAGLLTTTKPSTLNHVIKPILVAISETEGIVNLMLGVKVEPGAPTGPTGPTGPSSVGATGPTGPTGPSTLEGLTDVEYTVGDPQDNALLQYDFLASKWKPEVNPVVESLTLFSSQPALILQDDGTSAGFEIIAQNEQLQINLVTDATDAVNLVALDSGKLSVINNLYVGGQLLVGSEVGAQKGIITVSPSASGSDGFRVTDTSSLIELTITGASYSYQGVGGDQEMLYATGNDFTILVDNNKNFRVNTGGSERLRIDISGHTKFVTGRSFSDDQTTTSMSASATETLFTLISDTYNIVFVKSISNTTFYWAGVVYSNGVAGLTISPWHSNGIALSDGGSGALQITNNSGGTRTFLATRLRTL